MTHLFFLAVVGLLYGCAVFVAAHYFEKTQALRFGAVLMCWLAYVGMLSALGVISDVNARPPGIVFLALPIAACVVFLIASQRTRAVALAIPLGLLTVAQVFRLGVELGLHQLWMDGLVPRLMTYEGGNLDIYIGLSAPVAAYAWMKGWLGLRGLQLWNVAGLLALFNIMIRAVLTSPNFANPLGAEIPNVAMGMFPFTYIAGFLAPTALALHVLALRHISALKHK